MDSGISGPATPLPGFRVPGMAPAGRGSDADFGPLLLSALGGELPLVPAEAVEAAPAEPDVPDVSAAVPEDPSALPMISELLVVVPQAAAPTDRPVRPEDDGSLGEKALDATGEGEVAYPVPDEVVAPTFHATIAAPFQHVPEPVEIEAAGGTDLSMSGMPAKPGSMVAAFTTSERGMSDPDGDARQNPDALPPPEMSGRHGGSDSDRHGAGGEQQQSGADVGMVRDFSAQGALADPFRLELAAGLVVEPPVAGGFASVRGGPTVPASLPGREAAEVPPDTDPPTGDVHIALDSGDGLDVTLSARHGPMVERLRAESPQLARELGLVGTEVEAIRVELRADPGAHGRAGDGNTSGEAQGGMAPGVGGDGRRQEFSRRDRPEDMTGILVTRQTGAATGSLDDGAVRSAGIVDRYA